jgi:hypothetical protein
MIDLLQTLYFHILAEVINYADTERRNSREYLLNELKKEIKKKVPDFATPEWFKRRHNEN